MHIVNHIDSIYSVMVIVVLTLKPFSSFHFTLLSSQKQFFDVVPISATGFLPPESNATTTPTTTTPGISSGAASTTSPLNTGDSGGGKSGQQVCTNCDRNRYIVSIKKN